MENGLNGTNTEMILSVLPISKYRHRFLIEPILSVSVSIFNTNTNRSQKNLEKIEEIINFCQEIFPNILWLSNSISNLIALPNH